MSEELCPFCGAKAMFVADSKELVACSNIRCPMNHVIVRKTAWNGRPTPTPEVQDWEKTLDEQWSSINAPADNQDVKDNVKSFIRSILADKTEGELPLQALEEEALIKILWNNGASSSSQDLAYTSNKDKQAQIIEYHLKKCKTIAKAIIAHVIRPVVSKDKK